MKILLLFLCLLQIESTAQQIPVPTFEHFKPIGIKPSRKSFLKQYSIERQAELIQQEAQIKEEQEKALKQIIVEQKKLTSFDLNQAKQPFNSSLSALKLLLNAPRNQVAKKAIFQVEKAFLGNTLLSENFEEAIVNIIEILRKYAVAQGWNWQDYNTRQKTLLLRFTDTLVLKDTIILPFKYDHQDPYGVVDHSKFFVSKLLTTKMGQCHSLPLLYKILADEIDVEAYLCLMPQHSYIRISDASGKWYNFETTCGKIVPTTWLVASGFVSSEAIANKIYMDTLGHKAFVTNAIADLIEGYVAKFGYDDWVLQSANIALEHNPKDIRCLLWKSNYLTIHTQQLIQAANYPPKSKLVEYPEIWNNYQKLMQVYSKIDQLGHVTIPNVVYQEWLNKAP